MATLRWLLMLTMLMPAAVLAADEVALPRADAVLVIKSERRLVLLRDGQPYHSFSIALGEAPEGRKRQRGDNKTPEGRYRLDWKNPNSQYYKAIHISYPNAADRLAAERAGVDPGGDLVIHGMPTEAETEPWNYYERDWTNGCIALTNPDMDLLWQAVEPGTPIEIRP